MRRAVLRVHPKQRLFLESEDFISGFVGGRGVGKSHVGCFKVLKTARDGDRGMAISPTYRVIEDTTWPTFKAIAKEYGFWKVGRTHPTPMAKFRTIDGGVAEIVFRSAENPELLRGPSLPWLWFDEASVMVKAAFDYALPSLRHKGRMGKCLMTFTPKGRRHWTFDVFFREVTREQVDTGEVDEDDVREIGGRLYVPTDNSYLVQAHTKESWFLDPKYYDLIRQNYTSSLAAQELAGEFVDLAGLIFKAEWFRYCDVAPRIAARVRYWDRASTPGSGKYTAGVLAARDDQGLVYYEDVKRGQWSPAERDRIIDETALTDAKKYGNEVVIYGEQEGGSAGAEISQQFIRRLSGFPVYRDIVSGKRSRMVDGMELPGEAKVNRAQGLAAQAEAGNIILVRGPWNDDFVTELTGFPEYAYSDQVDGASGAFNKLHKHNFGDPGEVMRPEVATSAGAQFGLMLARSRERRRGL